MKTHTIYSSDDSITDFSTGDTFKFGQQVPSGYHLSDLIIKLKVTPTFTGTLTNVKRIHSLLHRVTLKTDSRKSASILIDNGEAVPMAAVLSQAFKETQNYKATPRATAVAKSPKIAASGTEVQGKFKLHCPISGTSLHIAIELDAPSTLSDLSTYTAASGNIQIGYVFAPTRPDTKFYDLECSYLSDSRQSFANVSYGAIWCASSFGDKASNVHFGYAFNKEKILSFEEDWEDQISGLVTSNKNPATDAVVYVLGNSILAEHGTVKVKMKDGTTKMGSAIFRETGASTGVQTTGAVSETYTYDELYDAYLKTPQYSHFTHEEIVAAVNADPRLA